MYVQLIYIYFFALWPWAGDHAIYISVTELVHHQEQERVSAHVRVFSDDLQDVLKNYAYENGLAYSSDTTATGQALITSYFSENFQVSVNGKASLDWRLQTMRAENDATFLYFLADTHTAWRQVDLHAPFFTEVFSSQVNTFSIVYAGGRYHARTSGGATRTSIALYD